MVREPVFPASSSNWTGLFQSSSSRTVFTTRHSHGTSKGSERDHAQFFEDVAPRKAPRRPRLDLMASPQKAAHPLTHKRIEVMAHPPHAAIAKIGFCRKSSPEEFSVML